MLKLYSKKYFETNRFLKLLRKLCNIINLFRIAIVQNQVTSYDCDLNTRKGLKIIEGAKKLSADIVLFPECWIASYKFHNINKKLLMKEIVVSPGHNAGCSCAFSPIIWDKNGNSLDNTIVLADEITESILISEYEMKKVRNYKNREMMGNTFRKV